MTILFKTYKNLLRFETLFFRPIFYQSRSYSARTKLTRKHLISRNDDEVNTNKIYISKNISLSFTCKICNVRSTRTFSRQSYEKGVVIIRCPECQSLHLISDNKGWFYDSNTYVFNIRLSSVLHVKVIN